MTGGPVVARRTALWSIAAFVLVAVAAFWGGLRAGRSHARPAPPVIGVELETLAARLDLTDSQREAVGAITSRAQARADSVMGTLLWTVVRISRAADDDVRVLLHPRQRASYDSLRATATGLPRRRVAP